LWNHAIARPVAKSQSPAESSDFRPISILPVFAKAFECLLNDQILAHVTANSLLSYFQTGFRLGYNTITALVKVTEDLRTAMESDFDSMLVLLDFSKAFDCVNHSLLIHKLQTAGSLMASVLAEQTMVVETDGNKSATRAISSGVPQGSIVSPLYFSMFIRQARKILNH
jgi:Reverse transcriptase (RNA-dependent DNA polymerase)